MHLFKISSAAQIYDNLSRLHAACDGKPVRAAGLKISDRHNPIMGCLPSAKSGLRRGHLPAPRQP